MTDILRGIYIGDLLGWLTLAEALEALKVQTSRDGAHLSDTAIDMQRKVAALTKVATGAGHRATTSRKPQGNASTGSGEVVNVKQAAELIGITPQAVRKNCAVGNIEGVNPTGHTWIISRADVDRFAYEREHK